MEMQPQGREAAREALPGERLHGQLAGRSTARRPRLTIVLTTLVLVAIGLVGGVAIGRATADGSAQAGPPAFGGGFPGGDGIGAGGGGFPGGGNVTFGTIESIDGSTIMLQAADGTGTVTVHVGGDAQIRITQDGSLDDLETGDTVVVAGEQNDGTLEAASISEGGFELPADVGAAVP